MGTVEDPIRAMVRELVREEVDARLAANPLGLIPHHDWPCPSPRRACELARSGAIEATRKGRTWYATRAALDAYETRPKAKALAPEPPKTESFADLNAGRGRRSNAA